MRLLKIKGYQVFANYRKPMSFNFWDTYPLPPLSTVKGWFHNVVEANDYIPMAMSIQGKYDSIVYDLQKIIKFDRKRKEDTDRIILEDFNASLSNSPTYVANMFNMELIIYIKAEEIYLNKFMQNIFKLDYPYLGRREDLIRMDYVDFVEVDRKTFSSFRPYYIKHGIYVSDETARSYNLKGICYKMNFKYDKDMLKKTGLRYFDKKDVVYVDNGLLKTGEMLFDEKENTVIDLIGE